MRHAKGLLTPARALHRVLLLSLANATSKNITTTSTILLPRAWPPSPTTPPHAPCQRTPRRSFSSTAVRPAAPQKKLPRDKDIPYRWVRIPDAAGTLSAPQRTDDVLASLPSGHSLIMVAPPPPSPASGVLQPKAAICRIVDTAGQAKAAEAAEREAKQTAQQTKTLELNWAIAAHDLTHKMKRLGEFLGKGMRVEVMLARKRGTRKATGEEATALVERVREAVASVPDVSEYKRSDGHVGGVLRLFFEGPKGKRKEKKDKGGEEM
ncbi:hypothetical protein F4678DRAFT_412120 [Xylaria arbuscula]|nr:hypothetical protein F4678DRAFT_412120 [Xylaria arbuscula]